MVTLKNGRGRTSNPTLLAPTDHDVICRGCVVLGGSDSNHTGHQTLLRWGPHSRHAPTRSLPRSAFAPCVGAALRRVESHAVSPPNRLWLTEPGAFLQFVPTSLLNHLHYLTGFPQRDFKLSVSLMKVCTGRNSQATSLYL